MNQLWNKSNDSWLASTLAAFLHLYGLNFFDGNTINGLS
jgi:hypothetical protein